MEKEWINGGIFSDDTAVIVGDVEDRTSLDIYKQKLSPFDTDKKSYFQEVCEKAEPRIRSLINAQLGMDFIPFTNNMSRYPWARSYVAGKQADEILVIRFISRANFTYYKNGGDLLDKHKTIVQHDMMVHGSRLCRFVGYVFDQATKQIDPRWMVMIDVEKDRNHMTMIWGKISEFQNRLEIKVPPKMNGIDSIDLREILTEFVNDFENYNLHTDVFADRVRDKVYSFLGGGL